MLANIRKDTDWLRENRLMDYSMMVGLAKRPENEPIHVDRHVVRCVSLVAETDDDPNLVYLGIIDILTYYNCRKSIETLTMGWFGDISCQPPGKYAARFLGF